MHYLGISFLSLIFPVVSKCTLLVLRLAWPVFYASERAGSRGWFLGASLSLLDFSSGSTPPQPLIEELLLTIWMDPGTHRVILEPQLVFRQISARLSSLEVVQIGLTAQRISGSGMLLLGGRVPASVCFRQVCRSSSCGVLRAHLLLRGW